MALNDVFNFGFFVTRRDDEGRPCSPDRLGPFCNLNVFDLFVRRNNASFCARRRTCSSFTPFRYPRTVGMNPSPLLHGRDRNRKPASVGLALPSGTETLPVGPGDD